MGNFDSDQSSKQLKFTTFQPNLLSNTEVNLQRMSLKYH
jgi:hypothetical protein